MGDFIPSWTPDGRGWRPSAALSVLPQLPQLTMSKNAKPNKCQAARYSTIAEMEYAQLDASTIANNVAMASQVSRRKKIRTCGCDQHKRKQSVRDRLRKKLEAKKST